MQAIADSIINSAKTEKEIIEDIQNELSNGGDVNAKVKGAGGIKSSLLCVAARCAKPLVVNFLLRRKSNVNYLDGITLSPLQNVTWNATPLNESAALRIVGDLLIAGADIESAKSSRAKPLHCASRNGLVSVVKELLQEKPNLAASSVEEGSCLCAAACRGHYEVCKLLLDAGVNVDGNESTRDDKKTPLMLASKGGHSRVVELLLEKGADVKKQDASGNYAIHHAAAFGSTEILRLLLAHEKNLLEVGNNELYRALDIAVLNRRYGCVEFLLDRNPKLYASTWPLVSSMNDLSLIKLIALHTNMYVLRSQDLAELVSRDFIGGAEFILTEVEDVEFKREDLQHLMDNVAKGEEMKQLLRDRINNQDENGKLLPKVKIEAKEEEVEKAGTRRTRSSSTTTNPKPKNSADPKSKKKPAPKTTKKK